MVADGRLSVRESGFTIEVSGKFAPEHILPHGLAAYDLLAQTDLRAARVRLAGLGLSDFSLPWVRVRATDKSLRMEVRNERRLDLARDLLISIPNTRFAGSGLDEHRSDDLEDLTRVVDSLPNADDATYASPVIDVTRVQVSYSAHVGSDPDEAADRALLRGIAVPNIFGWNVQGISRLELALEVGSALCDHRLLTVEPSRREGSWIFVRAGVAWDATPDEIGTSAILARASTQWKSTADLEEQAAKVIDELPSWTVGGPNE